MITYIDGKEHVLVARVRPAGPPFEDQDGSLVGVDYQDFSGGGMCNVRFTREQAQCLQAALQAYLSRGNTITFAKGQDGKLVTRDCAGLDACRKHHETTTVVNHRKNRT